MKKEALFIFSVFIIIFLLTGVLASPIEDNIPIQIQTTDASGNIITGTFTFTINISNSNTCSPVLYSDSTTRTTDARGIVSYNLENVDLDFDEQYWFCYYRDGVLKETAKIGRMPYAFRAKNITLSGVEVDKNLGMGSYNVTAAYLFGNGSQLTGIASAGSSDTLDGYDSSFFMPLNKSIFGNFSFNDNITANYGFFGWLGSLANRITKLFVIDVNATGTINAASFVGDGSGVSNVVASSLGDIGCTADKYLQWSGSSWVCANMPSSGSSIYVNLIPEGTVAAFNRTTCPAGWIPANGTNSTPDLRGLFIRGSGTSGVLQDAAGNWFSATYGTYQNDSFQEHKHEFNYWDSGTNTAPGGHSSGASYTWSTSGAKVSGYGTPRTGAETRPANIALLYCVKVAESSPETGNLFDISGNLIYVKNISHSLGVGTQVPNARLEVNGTFSVKNSTGTQGLYQDAQGKVGIGTTGPTDKLNVIGNANITGNLTLGIGQIMYNSTSNSYIYYNTTDWIAFGTGTGGTPAGAVMAFNSATCPAGWIPADGTSGTPDLRGLFVRGAGTSGVLKYANGSWISAAYGTYQNDSFQGHRHYTAKDGAAGATELTSSNFLRERYNYGAIEDYFLKGDSSEADIGQASGPITDGTYGTPRTGAETRPASYVLTYCMKTTEDSTTSNTLFQESGGDVSLANSSYSFIGGMIGEIKIYAGATPPSGWFLCDGSAKSRTNYATLFSIIGTTYGVGDGSTTFNLPNLTNKFPRGNTPGATGGSDNAIVVSHSHTFTGSALPTHSHTTTHWRGALSTGSLAGTGDNTLSTWVSTSSAVSAGTPSGTISTEGSSGTGANIPAYVGVNYIIKY